MEENGEIDIYVLAFAIEANDDAATIKRMADEIKAVYTKYKYAKGSNNTYKTDLREFGFSIPKIVYGKVGLNAVAATGLKEQEREHNE